MIGAKDISSDSYETGLIGRSVLRLGRLCAWPVRLPRPWHFAYEAQVRHLVPYRLYWTAMFTVRSSNSKSLGPELHSTWSPSARSVTLMQALLEPSLSNASTIAPAVPDLYLAELLPLKDLHHNFFGRRVCPEHDVAQLLPIDDERAPFSSNSQPRNWVARGASAQYAKVPNPRAPALDDRIQYATVDLDRFTAGFAEQLGQFHVSTPETCRDLRQHDRLATSAQTPADLLVVERARDHRLHSPFWPR